MDVLETLLQSLNLSMPSWGQQGIILTMQTTKDISFRLCVTNQIDFCHNSL
jgi:hypothetical protein